MADNTVIFRWTTGLPLDFQLLDEGNNTIWNATLGTYEVFDPAHWTNYRNAMSEVPAASTNYEGPMPAIPRATLTLYIYQRTGNTAPTDMLVGGPLERFWDGSGFVSEEQFYLTAPVSPPVPVPAYLADPTGYPTGEDFLMWAASSGLSVPTGFDADAAAAAGREAFERDCNRARCPLLAGAPATRYFDPPGDRDSYLRLPECVGAVSITYWPAGQSGGTLLYPQVALPPPGWTQDYLLDPDPTEVAVTGAPYVGVQFINRQWFVPIPPTLMRSLQITAQWGYGLTLPSDAFTAMLTGALLRAVFGTLDAGDGLGPIPAFVKRWEAISRTTEEYDPNFLFNLRKSWCATYDAAVQRYFRWTL